MRVLLAAGLATPVFAVPILAQGRLAGLVSNLGIHAGTMVHVVAASLGLSALLMTSALAFAAVKYLGAAYLVYLGAGCSSHALLRSGCATRWQALR